MNRPLLSSRKIDAVSVPSAPPLPAARSPFPPPVAGNRRASKLLEGAGAGAGEGLLVPELISRGTQSRIVQRCHGLNEAAAPAGKEGENYNNDHKAAGNIEEE